MFAVRNMLVLLAVMAGGVAALVWWLFAFGYPGAPSVSANREKPVVEAESREPVAEKSAPPAVAAATEAIKGLADQLGALKPEEADAAPKFDVARIESNGEAVIAGRAAPGASVELLQDGKVHDRTVADSSGAFVFIPKPLPLGRYDLTLRTVGPDGKATMSKGAVAVNLGSTKEEKQAAAPVAPAVPPVVLSKPAEDPDGRFQVEAVEAEDGGRLHVSGRSVPGSIVRLYLNDAYIATGTASADGRVQFSIRGGVKPGEYRVRLDHMNAAGNVLSRAEKVFNASTTLADAKPSASSPEVVGTLPSLGSAPRSPTSTEAQTSLRAVSGAGQQISTSQRENAIAPISQTSPRLPVTGKDAAQPRPIQETNPLVATGSTDQRSIVVVPRIDTRVVVRGDSLWRISQATYGHGKRYTEIFTANRSQIRNPNLIYPDQIFVLPNALPK
ncbi:LysM peptidoglycan-binding domain-containing protein [Pseudorhodoplanes sinuspersici]|nr:LysM peptidoglycan-binding domain-containing protein [Pseudorhodoplanes sinuspersici]